MWQPNEFLIADTWSPEKCHKVAGYTCRGLGIHVVIQGSPKGRRPPTWSLTHLGSGHVVVRIAGKVAEAFLIASEIAECSEWDAFDGLDGWRNTDPGLPDKVREIMTRYPKAVSRGGGWHSHEAARAIATARA